MLTLRVVLGVAVALTVASAQAPTGTAAISGRVVALDTGLPIRGASVELSQEFYFKANTRDAEGRAQAMQAVRTLGGTSSIAMTPDGRVTAQRVASTAVADEFGRYEFTHLAPGVYVVRARKRGFLDYAHGDPPGSPPNNRDLSTMPPGPLDLRQHSLGHVRRISLAEGQRIEDAIVRLPRPGVLAGVVIDELGQPVYKADVFIRSERQRFMANTYSHRATTNDLGEFRFFDLQPGTYHVSVAAIVDGVTKWTVYYPGTTDELAAQSVLLDVGSVASGIMLTAPPGIRAADYRPRREGVIAGVAVDHLGTPLVGAIVGVRPRVDAPDVGSTHTDELGRFRIPDLEQGERFLAVTPMDGRNRRRTAFYPGTFEPATAQPLLLQATPDRRPEITELVVIVPPDLP